MTTERRRYLAYMLRLWQVRANGNLAWRASLESPHTGQRLGFASLEALFKFLAEQTRKPETSMALAPDAEKGMDGETESKEPVAEGGDST